MAMHFDLVDLRLMVRVAEANSLTRGAEAVSVSVPTASTRIRNIEESSGTKLFYRTRQGVTLTPPGQAFVHHARLVLGQLEPRRSRDGRAGGGRIRRHARTRPRRPARGERDPRLPLRQICSGLHRSIRLRIQVGSFEVACRMIVATVGVGVLPESAARRHAQTMAIHIVPLSDAWSVREMHVCVRSMAALPVFARDLVTLRIEDARAAPVPLV